MHWDPLLGTSWLIASYSLLVGVEARLAAEIYSAAWPQGIDI